ncbi:uncharacterized protein [Amphiura filiformis]|uniref:uncharacterized protein n=1 Tax=Amphiura filiformis TaxID=82378 RepID=UPI003B2285A3
MASNKLDADELVDRFNRQSINENSRLRLRKELTSPTIFVIHATYCDPRDCDVGGTFNLGHDWKICRVGYTVTNPDDAPMRENMVIARHKKCEEVAFFTLPQDFKDTHTITEVRDGIKKKLGYVIDKSLAQQMELSTPTEWVITTPGRLKNLKTEIKKQSLPTTSILAFTDKLPKLPSYLAISQGGKVVERYVIYGIVYDIPRGHKLFKSTDTSKSQKYCRVGYNEDNELSPEEAIEEIKAKIGKDVKVYILFELPPHDKSVDIKEVVQKVKQSLRTVCAEFPESSCTDLVIKQETIDQIKKDVSEKTPIRQTTNMLINSPVDKDSEGEAVEGQDDHEASRDYEELQLGLQKLNLKN